MPKVELLRPRSLNTRNILFIQNVVRTDIPASVAIELIEDPRFKVTGLTEADFAERGDKPVRKEELYDAILTAIEGLDIDDEDSFTATGKPHHAAISAVLGYSVTPEERDAAMRSTTAKEASLEAAEDEGSESEKSAAKTKGGVRIVRAGVKDKKEAALNQLNKVPASKTADNTDADPASGGDAEQHDASKDGAMEV